MEVNDRVDVLCYSESGTVVNVRADCFGEPLIDVRLDSDGSVHVCRNYEIREKSE